MKDNLNFKKSNIRIFIILILGITVVFFSIGKLIINSFMNQYYELKIEEAMNFSQNLSDNLINSTEATNIINQLIAEKIEVASRQVLATIEEHDDKLLAELAELLEVDVIYTYTPEGEIIYSSTGEYIGWKAYEGHPVHSFMTMEEKSYIDGIRKDTETGVQYKYGYYKGENGNFVQIGIDSQELKAFIDSFSVEQLLNTLAEEENIVQIRFIDNNLNVVSSNDPKAIGDEISNPQVKVEVLSDREYGRLKTIDDEKVYEVFVPIRLNGSRYGILSISYSLKSAEGVINRIIFGGLLSLILLYLLILYALISTHKKNKKQMQLTYYDPMTGLPNKQYFKEFMAIELQKDTKCKKAILMINCQNLKAANMTFGYAFGDEIIKELGSKIYKLTNESRMAFRFTDDKFILYVRDYLDKEEIISYISIMNNIFHEAFLIKSAKHYLKAEIGIVEIGKNVNVDQLLKDAAISLAYINQSDDTNYVFFNEVMESNIQREAVIENEIRRALSGNSNNILNLVYQPQINLQDNKTAAFEALVRMNSNVLGFVSPIEFIPIAEKKQLIVPMGNWILQNACNFIATLKKEGHPDVKVAVNVSGTQLLQNDFIPNVMDIIKETKINPVNLELEITESVAMEEIGVINNKLKELREIGVQIALDDFGTGYSSLSIASDLNIDILKIDKSFIDKILTQNKNISIVKEIISISHTLGLKVVAEGVEAKEQEVYLRENACDMIQGYLYSKPICQEEALAFLEAYGNRKVLT